LDALDALPSLRAMFCAAARHSFLVSYSFLYELLCKNKHIMCQCVWLYRRLLLWADSAFVTETILGVNLMACNVTSLTFS